MTATVSTATREGLGHARGTCGELAQGVLPGGRRFQVTCPIDVGVEVGVRVRPASAFSISGLPPGTGKTERALRLAAELLELGPVAIEVRRDSRLATAKGLASSTADIVAAARALAHATGIPLDAPTLARLATEIEPSDGVMYDGVVTVDPDDGTLLQRWRWAPSFAIAMFVPRLSRDTAAVCFDGQRSLADVYDDLLAEFDAAMRAADEEAIARSATRSAALNQAVVPNPLQPELRRRFRSAGADGLVVGHSGTVCGLLFAGGDEDAATASIARLLPHLPSGTSAQVTRLVG